jgi:hypothetical protein
MYFRRPSNCFQCAIKLLPRKQIFDLKQTYLRLKLHRFKTNRTIASKETRICESQFRTNKLMDDMLHFQCWPCFILMLCFLFIIVMLLSNGGHLSFHRHVVSSINKEWHEWSEAATATMAVGSTTSTAMTHVQGPCPSHHRHMNRLVASY